ncbi:hypothetical protein AAG570_000325 [Ranatra chinensis]|uniref:Uncharacterized protein n=1 Tax=Ranatra chinensis TaxID=642074 RepID=A0ABD0ZHY1_9HEMI
MEDVQSSAEETQPRKWGADQNEDSRRSPEVEDEREAIKKRTRKRTMLSLAGISVEDSEMRMRVRRSTRKRGDPPLREESQVAPTSPTTLHLNTGVMKVNRTMKLYEP